MIQKNISRFHILPALCLALGFLSACTPAKTVKKSAEDVSKSTSTESALPPGVEVSEPSLRGGEFSVVPGLAEVHFEYDAYGLEDDAREALKKNATYLKAHPDFEVLVTGHCDERGTIEYNLALGQKRAKAVRDYYIRLGISGKSVATISYGKENPSCTESNETCWLKNRRAETRVRLRAGATPQAKPKRSEQ